MNSNTVVTYNGESKTVAQLAAQINIKTRAMLARLREMSIEDAMVHDRGKPLKGYKVLRELPHIATIKCTCEVGDIEIDPNMHRKHAPVCRRYMTWWRRNQRENGQVRTSDLKRTGVLSKRQVERLLDRV